MAGSTRRVDVTTTAAQISTNDTGNMAGSTLLLTNPTTNTASVWCGFSAAITPGTTKATDGLEIAPGGSVEFDLGSEAVFAVAASGTVTVSVAEVGI
jgi:hypothetical protein